MSGPPFAAACIQFTAGREPQPNLETVARLFRQARNAGADLIMTPEVTNFVEPSGRRRRETVRPEAEDAMLAGLRALARDTGAWVLIGSLGAIDLSQETEGEQPPRQPFVSDRRLGCEIVARYDKIHMFDVDLAGGES